LNVASYKSEGCSLRSVGRSLPTMVFTVTGCYTRVVCDRHSLHGSRSSFARISHGRKAQRSSTIRTPKSPAKTSWKLAERHKNLATAAL